MFTIETNQAKAEKSHAQPMHQKEQGTRHVNINTKEVTLQAFFIGSSVVH